MRLFIKEWGNKTATIMTENGQVVWTFSSVQNARSACREWQSLASAEPVTWLEDDSGEPLVCAAG